MIVMADHGDPVEEDGLDGILPAPGGSGWWEAADGRRSGPGTGIRKALPSSRPRQEPGLRGSRRSLAGIAFSGHASEALLCRWLSRSHDGFKALAGVPAKPIAPDDHVHHHRLVTLPRAGAWPGAGAGHMAALTLGLGRDPPRHRNPVCSLGVVFPTAPSAIRRAAPGAASAEWRSFLWRGWSTRRPCRPS